MSIMGCTSQQVQYLVPQRFNVQTVLTLGVKGTEIYYNAWEMSRDPTTYPEPELFKPERWLDDSGRLNGKEFDPAFGFGRR